MTKESKEDFLRNLSSWSVVVEDVAQRQSKLPHRGNGEKADEDGGEG